LEGGSQGVTREREPSKEEASPFGKKKVLPPSVQKKWDGRFKIKKFEGEPTLEERKESWRDLRGEISRLKGGISLGAVPKVILSGYALGSGK